MDNIKIVIVEDEAIVAMDLEQRLIGMGFHVVEIFKNGNDLLEHLSTLSVDLLLMDINLKSDMDGIELYKLVKEQYNIPAIFSTAYSDPSTLARVKALDPYGYIVKPYNDQELFRTIDIGLYKFKLTSELKEREEILQCIADSANDCIMMLDENADVIFWNQVSEAHFGLSSNDIIGKNWMDILYTDSEDSSSVDVNKHIPKIDKNATFDILAKNLDGQGMPMRMSVMPAEIKGLRRTICVMKDMSGQLKKEAELKRTKAKAEISDTAKQIFLSNISHELRTPLNGIIGMTELLSETQLSSEQSQYVNVLQKSSSMLLDTINDILDLTKLETGKLELEYKELSVKSIVMKIVEQYAYESRNKDITVNYEIDDFFPDKFIGDEFRIQQILSNIVDNAVKFTEKGHVTIKVEAQNIRYSYNEPLATVCITVADSGIGIYQKDLETIFDSFSQVDGSMTRGYEGAGIGLNLVKRLISIMNGHVNVESVPGKGSEFQVIFDLVISTEVKKRDAAIVTDSSTIVGSSNKVVQPESFEDLFVLVAEDNVVGQQVISHILNHKNIKFHLVENGARAIKALESRAYDIIFMDIEMPEMDGIEAALQIRESSVDRFNPLVPIVALTGHSTEADKERIIAAGMDGILIKPVRIEDVYNIISSTLFERDTVSVLQENTVDAFIPEMFIGEEDLYYQLVQVFVVDAKERVKSIVEAFGMNDWITIEKESHSLKGSASYVEAVKVTEEAVELNNMMKKNEYEYTDLAIQNLKNHVNDFCKKIENHLVEIKKQ